MNFSERAYRTYRVFECNRCKLAKIEPEEKPKDFTKKQYMGTCKANGREIPLMDDPQYHLFKAPDMCEDFTKGKPRKKKPEKDEEKNI